MPAMLFPCAGTIYFVAGEDPDEKSLYRRRKPTFAEEDWWKNMAKMVKVAKTNENHQKPMEINENQ